MKKGDRGKGAKRLRDKSGSGKGGMIVNVKREGYGRRKMKREQRGGGKIKEVGEGKR